MNRWIRTRQGGRRSPLWALSAVAATALAFAATTHFTAAYVPPESIKAYFPAAVAVEITKVCGAFAGPNVKLGATLDTAGLAKLAQMTGQRSLARIDVGRETLWLHDDGREGDLRAGDGSFTALTTLDLAAVRERAAFEERLHREGKLSRVPVWRDHELVGYESRTPFSIRDFEACLTVPIKPLPFGPPGPTNLGFEDLTTAVNQTLFIANLPELGLTNPVFTDTTRTYNPCTAAGNGDGVWTFGHIMRQMAGGSAPETFTEEWLKLYTADQTSAATNGFTVKAVIHGQQFIDDWKAAGGGNLDLDHPPFRLMAIVPRVDLRSGASNPYGGSPHDGGEMRLIFGAVKPLSPCENIDFSVIFEFGVPMDTCAEIKAWAQSWRALSDFDLGTNAAGYLSALEALTTQITEAGAEPGNPNGSALNQLRSNELDLGDDFKWRIREYHLNGFLEQATTVGTPDDRFRVDSPEYKVFDTLIQSPSIPSAPPTLIDPTTNGPVPFLGAEGIVPFVHNGVILWGTFSDLDFSIAAVSDQRHRRAMQTCSGCHAGKETGTQFAHMMNPVDDDISPFLAGNNSLADPEVVIDPVAPSGTPGQKARSFFDLKRRQNDMNAAANQMCALVAVEALANEHLEE